MKWTLEMVSQVLESSDGRLKTDALFEAVKSNFRGLGPEILSLMKREQDPEIKGRCAWALGRLGHKEAYPFLVHNLKHTSLGVRKWSAWALGELNLPRAAKHLRGALSQEVEDDTRRSMGGALRRLGGKPVRVHRRRLQKEIGHIKLPYTEDQVIGKMVNWLEKLRSPQDGQEIQALRQQMKDRDVGFYEAYIKWSMRRPQLERGLDDDTIVFC